MFNRRQFSLSATALLASAATGHASAQSLDSARLMCGFPAGGTTDAVSRRLADKLRGTYAKTVLVDNKSGAGGRLAVEELKRSANDGSVLLLTPASMITLYPHLYTRLGYRIDDVTPVCTVCRSDFGFGVGPAVPGSVKNLNDFLAWAKANPSAANYGSPGAGSPPHFIGALLAKESGLDLRHVPYRGSAPGIQDLLGGQLASFSSPVGDYLPHLKSGKLRLLATSGAARSRFTPEVATITEQGFTSHVFSEWYGLFLPNPAAPDLVRRLAAIIKAAATASDMGEGLAHLGLEAWTNTPGELEQALRSENRAWAPVVKRVGFTPES